MCSSLCDGVRVLFVCLCVLCVCGVHRGRLTSLRTGYGGD